MTINNFSLGGVAETLQLGKDGGYIVYIPGVNGSVGTFVLSDMVNSDILSITGSGITLNNFNVNNGIINTSLGIVFDTNTSSSTLSLSQVTTVLGIVPGTVTYVSDNGGSIAYINSSGHAQILGLSQTITLTGDVSGSGTSNINVTLNNIGVSPGTYNNVVVNSKGLVESAFNSDYPIDTGFYTSKSIPSFSLLGIVPNANDTIYATDPSNQNGVVYTGTNGLVLENLMFSGTATSGLASFEDTNQYFSVAPGNLLLSSATATNVFEVGSSNLAYYIGSAPILNVSNGSLVLTSNGTSILNVGAGSLSVSNNGPAVFSVTPTSAVFSSNGTLSYFSVSPTLMTVPTNAEFTVTDTIGAFTVKGGNPQDKTTATVQFTQGGAVQFANSGDVDINNGGGLNVTSTNVSISSGVSVSGAIGINTSVASYSDANLFLAVGGNAVVTGKLTASEVTTDYINLAPSYTGSYVAASLPIGGLAYVADNGGGIGFIDNAGKLQVLQPAGENPNTLGTYFIASAYPNLETTVTPSAQEAFYGADNVNNNAIIITGPNGIVMEAQQFTTNTAGSYVFSSAMPFMEANVGSINLLDSLGDSYFLSSPGILDITYKGDQVLSVSPGEFTLSSTLNNVMVVNDGTGIVLSSVGTNYLTASRNAFDFNTNAFTLTATTINEIGLTSYSLTSPIVTVSAPTSYTVNSENFSFGVGNLVTFNNGTFGASPPQSATTMLFSQSGGINFANNGDVLFNNGRNILINNTATLTVEPANVIINSSFGINCNAQSIGSNVSVPVAINGNVAMNGELSVNGLINLATSPFGKENTTGILFSPNISSSQVGTLGVGAITYVADNGGGIAYVNNDGKTLLLYGVNGSGSNVASTVDSNGPISIEALNYLGDLRFKNKTDNNNILTYSAPTTSMWVTNTAYTLGQMVAPVTANGYVYVCTFAGTSTGVEPAWITTPLTSVSDGSYLSWQVAYRYFGNTGINGPALVGVDGGALGTSNTTDKIALTWDNSGNVSIANNLSIGGALSLNGNLGVTGTLTAGNLTVPTVAATTVTVSGAITVPTMPQSDDSQNVATTAFVTKAIETATAQNLEPVIINLSGDATGSGTAVNAVVNMDVAISNSTVLGIIGYTPVNEANALITAGSLSNVAISASTLTNVTIGGSLSTGSFASVNSPIVNTNSLTVNSLTINGTIVSATYETLSAATINVSNIYVGGASSTAFFNQITTPNISITGTQSSGSFGSLSAQTLTASNVTIQGSSIASFVSLSGSFIEANTLTASNVTISGSSVGSFVSLTAPTVATTDNSKNVATTQYVNAALSAFSVTNPAVVTVNLTGEATGSGTTANGTMSLPVTLVANGVTAGTYTKVAVGSNGLVTVGESLLLSDIQPLINGSTLTNITVTGSLSVGSFTSLTSATMPTTDNTAHVATTAYVNNALSAYSVSNPATMTIIASGAATGTATGSGTVSIPLTLATNGVTAGIYSKVQIGSNGLVTQGLTFGPADVNAIVAGATLSGFQLDNVSINTASMTNVNLANATGEFTTLGISGTLTAPTVALNDNTDNVATTQFVQNSLNAYTGGTYLANITVIATGAATGTGSNYNGTITLPLTITENGVVTALGYTPVNPASAAITGGSIANTTIGLSGAASGVFTTLSVSGTLTAPTMAASDASNHAATTAFVQNALLGYAANYPMNITLTGGATGSAMSVNGTMTMPVTLTNTGVISAIGYTPLNAAGGSISGNLVVGGTLLSTGAIQAPTMVTTDNSKNVATTQFVNNYVSTALASPKVTVNVSGGATGTGTAVNGTISLPVTLTNTGVVTALGYTPLNSTGGTVTAMAVTGSLSAPTQPASDNSTNVATTAFVQNALANSIPYDLTGGFSGTGSASQIILQYISTRTVAFPANLAGSAGYAGTAATAAAAYVVIANGSSVGVISFAASATSATFSCNAFTLTPGIVLAVHGPATADTTLANVSITLNGSV